MPCSPDGICEPLTVTVEEKAAIQGLLARWEAESFRYGSDHHDDV